MDRDLYHNIKTSVALDEQAIAADGTVVGNIIDTKDFASLVFAGLSGVVTDGVHTILIEYSDDSGMAGAVTAVADDLHGDLWAFEAADDNVSKRVGYNGPGRYVRASIVTTAATLGILSLSVTALQSHPRHAPVA